MALLATSAPASAGPKILMFGSAVVAKGSACKGTNYKVLADLTQKHDLMCRDVATCQIQETIPNLDPSYAGSGCKVEFTIVWSCPANVSERKTVTRSLADWTLSADKRTGSFVASISCGGAETPPPPPAATDPNLGFIGIVSASVREYMSCPNLSLFKDSPTIARGIGATCNGRNRCSFPFQVRIPGPSEDPVCRVDYSVDYTCGTHGRGVRKVAQQVNLPPRGRGAVPPVPIDISCEGFTTQASMVFIDALKDLTLCPDKVTAPYTTSRAIPKDPFDATCKVRESCDVAIGSPLFQIADPKCDRFLFGEYTCVDAAGLFDPTKRTKHRSVRVDVNAAAPASTTGPVSLKLSCGSDFVESPSFAATQQTLEAKQAAYVASQNSLAGYRKKAWENAQKRVLNLKQLGMPARFGVLSGTYGELCGRIPCLGDVIGWKLVPSPGQRLLADPAPIATVMKKFQDLVKDGKLPADEKPPKDLKTYECPDNPKKGPECVLPLDVYRALLPELDSYVRFINANRGTLQQLGGALGREVWDRYIHHGCKLIARYLPGFAKVEVVKRTSDSSTAGDWDRSMSQSDSDNVLGKPRGTAGPAPKEYKGPPEREAEPVEICTVTHAQLADTLEKDVILISNRANTRGADPDVPPDPEPIKGTLSRVFDAENTAAVNLDGVNTNWRDALAKIDAALDHCIDGKRKNAQTCTEAASVESYDITSGMLGKVVWDFGGSTTIQDDNVNNKQPFTLSHSTGNTFRNWLTLQVLREAWRADHHVASMMMTGLDNLPFPPPANLFHIKDEAVRDVVFRKFVPFGASSADSVIQNEGKRYLDQLPLSQWQKCYLWNGNMRGDCDIFGKFALPEAPPSGVDPKSAAYRTAYARALADVMGKVSAFTRVYRYNMPLFKLALAPPVVNTSLGGLKDAWERAGCNGKKNPKYNSNTRIWGIQLEAQCASWDNKDRWTLAEGTDEERTKLAIAKQRAATFGKGVDQLLKQAGFANDPGLGDTGGFISDLIGPVVGKILGMLMKAAGIEDMMKTLAKAAGLTPEQANDCEDPDYRKETMKLPPAQDNKRGCLLRVFAKNFVDSLESIIVMLGNKLVDWAVDLLNTALKGVKAALITAAGSVPFAGGVLAAAVDIGWDLLMNFGAKALLKGFVVSQLPGWLQIRTLATKALDELQKHPIIAVVMGIVLQLIEAAVTYGDKGPLAIAFAEALQRIVNALRSGGPQNAFWIRAFSFAKLDLVKTAGSGEDLDFGRQAIQFGRSLLEGFKTAVSARLDQAARARFEAAVGRLQTWIMDLAKGDATLPGDSTRHNIASVAAKLMDKPVEFLTDIIGRFLLPVAIPVITSFVKMPEWVKEILNGGSEIIETAVAAMNGQGALTAAAVKGFIGRLAQTVRREVIERLPLGSKDLVSLAGIIFDWVVGFFSTLGEGEAQAQLARPAELVKKVIGLLRGFVTQQVGQLVVDARLRHEQALVENVINLIFDLVTGEGDARQRVLGGAAEAEVQTGLPGASVLLRKVVDFGVAYAQGRVKQFVEGTGLEGAVGLALDALLHPATGLLAKGRDFLANIGTWFQQNGREVMGRIVDTAVAFFDARVREVRPNAVVAAALKDVNCEDLVQGVQNMNAFVNPVMRILRDTFPENVQCGNEFLKGFICAVPQGVRDITVLLSASLAYGWENRRVCLYPAIVAGGAAVPFVGPGAAAAAGAGFALCGMGYFVGDEWDRLKCAWKEMGEMKRFFVLMKALGKVACNLVGQAMFDFVLGAFSGGTSLTATIPARIQALARKIGAVKNAVGIGDKMRFLPEAYRGAVDNAAAILKEAENQMTASSGCVKWDPPAAAASTPPAAPETPAAPPPSSSAGLPAPIDYVGGPPLIGIEDVSGSIRFVKEPVAANPDAWEKAEPKVHKHFATAYCADLNSGTKNYPASSPVVHVFGPDKPFRVLDRFVWKQTGGAVFATVADGTTFGFGHLTEISEKVFRAAKDKTELPAGTYIGTAKEKIGVTKGPHCHIQAWKSANEVFKHNALLQRKDWFTKLRRVPWVAPNDTATK